MSGWRSFSDDPPPADDNVVIYAKRPRSEGEKWRVGLAYRTVSNAWCDTEAGFERIDIEFWSPLPPPPRG